MAANPEVSSDLARVTDVISRFYDGLKTTLPGFRERYAQRKMAWVIAKTLVDAAEGERIQVVEAGTGVGKSMAYLLGAVAAAEVLNKQVVISTATTALQAQLADKDLPMFLKATGLDKAVKVAKGRGRYICDHHLGTLTGSASGQETFGFESDDGFDGGLWPFAPTPSQVEAVKFLEEQRTAGWQGDLDTLGSPLDPSLVPIVTASRSQCLAAHCPNYHNCAFFEARRGLKNAPIIVANHDLVLSERAMADSAEEGRILPAPEEAIWVFDEGHHVPTKAVAHFASALTFERVAQDVRRAMQTLEMTEKHLQVSSMEIVNARVAARQALQLVGKRVSEVGELAAEVFGNPTQTGGFNGHGDTDTYRFQHGIVPETLAKACGEALKPVDSAGKAFAVLQLRVKEGLKDKSIPDALGRRLMPRLGATVDGLGHWGDVLSAFADKDESGSLPTARWIERRKGKRDSVETTMNASPVSAAGALAHLLWNPIYGAVITSATLTGLGEFRHFAAATGLPKGTRYERLPTPFDLSKQAVLSVPLIRSPKDDPVGHTQDVTQFILDGVSTDGGTLILFTSRRQMREVYDVLPKDLRARILLQGDLPREALLKRHAERIKQGSGSILMGLQSFAEGIDLPDQLCQHVVIAKLPFAVPDSPVAATYAEWLETQGRHPFAEVSLPEASRTLTQWCGRLIRTETDSGRITVLDPRLRTTRYGKQLLATLPPFRQELP